MKKHLLIFSLCLIVVVSVRAQQQHTVVTGAVTFQPASITINAGDQVTWSNTSSDTHTSTSGSGCAANGIWASGNLAPGATFSHTFNTPGTFPYFCEPHCGMGMTGTVTVVSANGIFSGGMRQGIFQIQKLSPNPADHSTVIEYTVSSSANVQISIVSNTGRIIKNIEIGRMMPGTYSHQIDLSDVPKGIYICNLLSDNDRAGILLSVY